MSSRAVRQTQREQRCCHFLSHVHTFGEKCDLNTNLGSIAQFRHFVEIWIYTLKQKNFGSPNYACHFTAEFQGTQLLRQRHGGWSLQTDGRMGRLCKQICFINRKAAVRKQTFLGRVGAASLQKSNDSLKFVDLHGDSRKSVIQNKIPGFFFLEKIQYIIYREKKHGDIYLVELGV